MPARCGGIDSARSEGGGGIPLAESFGGRTFEEPAQEIRRDELKVSRLDREVLLLRKQRGVGGSVPSRIGDKLPSRLLLARVVDDLEGLLPMSGLLPRQCEGAAFPRSGSRDGVDLRLREGARLRQEQLNRKRDARRIVGIEIGDLQSKDCLHLGPTRRSKGVVNASQIISGIEELPPFVRANGSKTCRLRDLERQNVRHLGAVKPRILRGVPERHYGDDADFSARV